MFPRTFNECIEFPGTGNGKMKRTERCLNVNMKSYMKILASSIRGVDVDFVVIGL